MSLKHLLNSLKGSMPFGIVLSVTTPSGYAYAKKAFPEIQVIAAPLDFTFTVRRFIRRINPALLILNELEIEALPTALVPSTTPPSPSQSLPLTTRPRPTASPS